METCSDPQLRAAQQADAGGRRFASPLIGKGVRRAAKMASKTELERIIKRLHPVLGPAGFDFELSEAGVGSGGAFAAGYFSRPPTRIGLIVRGTSLGMPSCVLESGVRIRSHCDLVRELGSEDEPLLEWDEDNWKLVTAAGQDAVEALAWELSNFILPALEAGHGPFGKADDATGRRRPRGWTQLAKSLREIFRLSGDRGRE